jgi:hypothetical protein
MKTLLKLLSKLLPSIESGDLSKHRLYATRYEDLCK